MFADDTSILLRNKDIKELFDTCNKELEPVDQWLIANRLSVNVFKTYYVLFKTEPSKLMTKKFLYCDKIKFILTNLDTIPETNLIFFQREVLVQYVSKQFITVVQLIGIELFLI